MTLEEMFCDLYDKYGNDFKWYMIPFAPVSYTHLISLPEEQMTLKIGYEPIKGDPEDDSCDHSDNDDTQDEEDFSNPEVYTEEEMEAVEGHLQQHFGKVENVFHELVSPDIHVDICICLLYTSPEGCPDGEV